jgi:hypothetical protein
MLLVYTEDYHQVKKAKAVLAIAYETHESIDHPLMSRTLSVDRYTVYRAREAAGFGDNWTQQDTARRLRPCFAGAYLVVDNTKFTVVPPFPTHGYYTLVDELEDTLYTGCELWFWADDSTQWRAGEHVIVQCNRPDVFEACCPEGLYYANDTATHHDVSSNKVQFQADTHVTYTGLDDLLALCCEPEISVSEATQRFATNGTSMTMITRYVYPPMANTIIVPDCSYVTGLWVSAGEDAKISIELKNGRRIPLLYLADRFVCPITRLPGPALVIHTTRLGILNYRPVTVPPSVRLPRTSCFFGYPEERSVDLIRLSLSAPAFALAVTQVFDDRVTLSDASLSDSSVDIYVSEMSSADSLFDISDDEIG